jgi:tetratricopeptide (TPR) repeat protein
MILRIAKNSFLTCWRGVLAVLELGVSKRGMPLCFLVGAALLVCGGWVRPPMSADIRAPYLPLGIVRSITPPADVVLAEPRHFYWHSAGAFMFAVVGFGALLTLVWPRTFGLVAGIILACTIGAHAAVINQPALIEKFDLQLSQRRQLVTMVQNSPIWNPLPNIGNARIQRLGFPGEDELWGDLSRTTAYLVFGQWLIVWSLIGCLAGTSGRLWRRVAMTGGFTVFGFILLGAMGHERLLAEYHWYRCKYLESDGKYKEARESLQKAIALFPEFDELQRTWLIAGKLDYREGRHSPREFFFRTYQLQRNKESVRSFTSEEDIEWEFTYADDPRQNLAADLVGPDLSVDPSFTGARDYHIGLSPLVGPLAKPYRRDRTLDQRRTSGMFSQLLDQEPEAAPVRYQAADFWIIRGLIDYMATPTYSDSEGFDYQSEGLQLTSAMTKWQQGQKLDPTRADCHFYLGYLEARLNPRNAEEAERAFGPILDQVADRVLRAEALNILGESYLDAGRLREARLRYAASMDLFNLPKVINYRGQKGLGGL